MNQILGRERDAKIGHANAVARPSVPSRINDITIGINAPRVQYGNDAHRITFAIGVSLLLCRQLGGVFKAVSQLAKAHVFRKLIGSRVEFAAMCQNKLAHRKEPANGRAFHGLNQGKLGIQCVFNWRRHSVALLLNVSNGYLRVKLFLRDFSRS